MAGDDAAAGQAEVETGELLAVRQLNRDAGLQRTPLTVRQRDEAGLAGAEGIAPFGQFREFERALVVGEYAASALELGSGQ